MHYFHPLDEAFAFALGLFGFCCAKDCSVPICPLVVRYCVFFFLLIALDLVFIVPPNIGPCEVSRELL